jgi:branched-chain amino acid transport system permease protein
MHPFQQFFQQVINGIVIGSIYSLVALGYTMVFGILGFINFAHGDVYMLGTFLGLILLGTGRFSFTAALVGSAILTGIVGVAIEKACYKPIRRFGKGFEDTTLVAAIGVSIFLETLALILWGSETHPMGGGLHRIAYHFWGLRVSSVQITIVVVAVALMAMLQLFVKHTVTGAAMRATSQNMAAARLMGIGVNHIIAITFAIGSVMAAVGGMLVGSYFDAVYPMMGWTTGIPAFTAAVVGGVGSLPGAMIAGVLIGLIESLGSAYISSEFRAGFAFIILIITLLFMPQGFFKAKKGEGKV